jgi:hypothetical protein
MCELVKCSGSMYVKMVGIEKGNYCVSEVSGKENRRCE